MEVIEIIFLVLGVIVFIVSFLLPAGKKEDAENAAKISEDAIREMVDREIDDRKEKINEIVDETVSYSMEKAERSMERLMNEKMMSISEYSDTVLGEINKNHQEVVFLYDMLNDKHENLKTVASDAAKTASEVKQTMLDADLTAKEMELKVKEAKQAANEAQTGAQEARQAVDEAQTKAEELRQRIEEAERNTAKAIQEAEVVSRTVEELSVITARKEKSAKAAEEDFKPIVAEVVEAPKALTPKEEEVEKPKAVRKTVKKPRAAKTSKKDAKDTDKTAETENVKIIPADAVPAEVPEVAVSLKEEDGHGGRNNNERILELHKIGKSNMAIAKELGLGIGEVKLVIDLFEGM